MHVRKEEGRKEGGRGGGGGGGGGGETGWEGGKGGGISTYVVHGCFPIYCTCTCTCNFTCTHTMHMYMYMYNMYIRLYMYIYMYKKYVSKSVGLRTFSFRLVILSLPTNSQQPFGETAALCGGRVSAILVMLQLEQAPLCLSQNTQHS